MAIERNEDIVEIHCGFADEKDADLLSAADEHDPRQSVAAGRAIGPLGERGQGGKPGWSTGSKGRSVMPLFLLDRDGVVVVNRPTNVKTPDQLALIPGAAEAIARLNGAGFDVAICTNQPEVARGVLSRAQLDHVHEGLRQMLAARGAKVELILCCAGDRKCPWMKPSGGMLREALARYGAAAADTPFVGDQADDLKAAFTRAASACWCALAWPQDAGARSSDLCRAGSHVRRSRRCCGRQAAGPTVGF
jgi:D-glycero-D-manno-heptose 1,7-bisphosphate phosphatase